MDNSNMKSQASGKRSDTNSKQYAASECPKKRRIQNCTFCKNHKKESPKKGHLCSYKDCKCPLCELLRKAQVTMRHQQRVWRHQKNKLQFSNSNFQDLTNVMDEKAQVCDKCRNHHIITLKKHHKCPYSKCLCPYCSLTFRRRELMKYLQRVRRSNVTSPEIDQFVDDAPSVDDVTTCESDDNGVSSRRANDFHESSPRFEEDSGFISLKPESEMIRHEAELQLDEADAFGKHGQTYPGPGQTYHGLRQTYPPPLIDIPDINSPPPLIPITPNDSSVSSPKSPLPKKYYCERFSERNGELMNSSPSLFSYDEVTGKESDMAPSSDMMSFHEERPFQNISPPRERPFQNTSPQRERLFQNISPPRERPFQNTSPQRERSFQNISPPRERPFQNTSPPRHESERWSYQYQKQKTHPYYSNYSSASASGYETQHVGNVRHRNWSSPSSTSAITSVSPGCSNVPTSFSSAPSIEAASQLILHKYRHSEGHSPSTARNTNKKLGRAQSHPLNGSACQSSKSLNYKQVIRPYIVRHASSCQDDRIFPFSESA